MDKPLLPPDYYEGKIRQSETIIRELWAMLERRQRCEECHGSGVLPFVDYANDDVSMEPCLCWSDAEVVIEKYEAEYGNGKASNE